MTAYIIGITFGALALLVGTVFLVIYEIKNQSFKKMVKRIGQTAEDQINGDLKVWARHTKNLFIPNNLYSYGENKVFEVDSILVTSKALIVVEIKSINGGIRGKATDHKWSKVLGEVTHDISNPIIQNERHIEHLIKMTSIKVPTISLIVYSDRAEFIDVKDAPGHVLVIRHAKLFETLDEIMDSLPVKMNIDKMQAIVNSIKNHRATSRSAIKLHKNITEKGHS